MSKSGRDIYLLTDPRDMQPKYVGSSVNIKQRMSNHKSSAKACDPALYPEKVKVWIKELLNLGLQYIYEVIDYAPPGLESIEYFWINFYNNSGCSLVNSKFKKMVRFYPTPTNPLGISFVPNTEVVADDSFISDFDIYKDQITMMQVIPSVAPATPKPQPFDFPAANPNSSGGIGSLINAAANKSVVRSAINELMDLSDSQGLHLTKEMVKAYAMISDALRPGKTMRDITRTSLKSSGQDTVEKTLNTLIETGLVSFVRHPSKGRPREAYVATKFVTN